VIEDLSLGLTSKIYDRVIRGGTRIKFERGQYVLIGIFKWGQITIYAR
jgi:hypothetical protein